MLKNKNSVYKKTYVGYTKNLRERLNKHNDNKGAKSTKGFKWKVVYKKKFYSKSKAMSFESVSYTHLTLPTICSV